MLFVLSMTTAEQKERQRAFEERIRFWRDSSSVGLEMPYGTQCTCLCYTLCSNIFIYVHATYQNLQARATDYTSKLNSSVLFQELK